MNILIDTCEFLHLLSGSTKLTPERRQAIEDPSNAVLLSAASATEIAIKCSIGKLHLPESPETYVPRNRVRHHIAELPLSEHAALLVTSLPWHHRDPFDRMLIAQALAHDLTFVTSDPLNHLYPVKLL